MGAVWWVLCGWDIENVCVICLQGWMAEMGGDGPLPSTSVPEMVDVPPVRAAGVRIAPTEVPALWLFGAALPC